MRRRLLNLAVFGSVLLGGISSARATSVRDLAEVKGIREHKIFGVGLVVGLRGTGDKGRETQKRIALLLNRLKLNVSPADLPSKNVALVMLTGKIRSDTAKGTRIDVTVSSLGDCTSLAGGELLPTPMHADDPVRVLARAQGTVAVSTGGHLTAGTITKGATVEEEIPSRALDRYTVNSNGERAFYMDLLLNEDRSDFGLANDIASAINTGLRAGDDNPAARPLSPTTVRVFVPGEFINRRVAFAQEVLGMPVVVDPPARVVINDRTGVVVVTGNVRISKADVNIGGVRITIDKEGTIEDLKGANRQVFQGSSAELIAVLKELDKAGALQAKLIIR